MWVNVLYDEQMTAALVGRLMYHCHLILKEFIETWLGMMKDNLGEYVKQYLMGTYGFWHICGDLEYEFVKFDIPENDWGIGQSYFF